MPILRARSLAATLVLLSTLSACSTIGSWFSGDKDEGIDKRTAEEIYADAKDKLDNAMYDSAAKTFEKLEAKFPYGRYAQQAQLEIAYAYFKGGDPASALAAVDRFTKLHPNHPSVDYAYYLKGLINFNEDQGLFSLISRQDVRERDPKAVQDSYDAFKELVTRFPNSRYAEDSRIRMSYLVNSLAHHEISVARYYQNRGAHLAAANRAQAVLRTFPQSPAVEEALAIMFSSYSKMGMDDLAKDARRVLIQNYPKSVFLSEVTPQKKAWWKPW